jgi:hypothetical protein
VELHSIAPLHHVWNVQNVHNCGIKRIVVLNDYPEDGGKILEEAKIKIDKLRREDLLPWLDFI